jgi:hypothetical protein
MKQVSRKNCFEYKAQDMKQVSRKNFHSRGTFDEPVPQLCQLQTG